MFNRRKIIAALVGAPAVTAVAVTTSQATAGVPVADAKSVHGMTMEKATEILIHNVRPLPNPESTMAMVARMNLKFIERHGDLINPAYVMSKAVEEFNGVKVEAKTRKLSTRWIFPEIDEQLTDPARLDQIRAEFEDQLVDDIAAEIRAELSHPSNANIQYCPFEIIRSSGVMIDPDTFDPVMTFMTRYGTMTRA